MKEIKVQCPAKINLTLEVLNKREDGFHNIKSIMQAIDLFDYLTIKATNYAGLKISLDGNSNEIPYNEKNLVYKAAAAFCKAAGIKNAHISVFIEKNIPVEAGLAGGSTDAAGTFWGLNEIFAHPLDNQKINELCASLGSDLNFCLAGGAALCSSRGENLEKLPAPSLDLSLIKPLGFGISAKEAYTKFSLLKDKTVPGNTDKMAQLLRNSDFSRDLLYNSLENAVIDEYDVLKFIKNAIPGSMMSGSGPTFFVLDEKIGCSLENMGVFEGLRTISHGVRCV